MAKNRLESKTKDILLLIETFALLLLTGYYLFQRNELKNNNSFKTSTTNSEVSHQSDENDFPPLDFPVEYFEASQTGLGAGTYGIIENSQAYQSYPTTNITLKPEAYSVKTEPLPKIKTDEEIHQKESAEDLMGEAKDESIRKYGDLARRFVGSAGESWIIDSIKYSDIDSDGAKETIISLSLIGANITGHREVVVKGENVIFSTEQNTFSLLIPSKNGNGFFLQWDDNFKKRDGYTSTRFIFDNNTFKPVFEQKVRYIRIQQSE